MVRWTITLHSCTLAGSRYTRERENLRQDWRERAYTGETPGKFEWFPVYQYLGISWDALQSLFKDRSKHGA